MLSMEASSVWNSSTLVDGNSYDWSGNHEEDYHHFWNVLTKPESKASYEESVVMADVIDIRNCSYSEGMALAADEEADIENMQLHMYFETLENDEEVDPDMAVDYTYIEVPDQVITTHCSDAQDHDENKYDKFIKDTEEGNWNDMKKFINDHPEVLTLTRFQDNGTALHHAIYLGNDWREIAICLVKRMTKDDLKIEDENGYTPLALAALYRDSVDLLMEMMVQKNPCLPNLGKLERIPVIVASWKGFPSTTRYLYQVTDERILSPEYENGRVGVQLLNHCINMKLFDIATDLVNKFDKILCHAPDTSEIYPIQAFAKTFSTLLIEHKKSSGWNQMTSNFGDCIMTCGRNLLDGSRNKKTSKESIYEELEHIKEARKFLVLICQKVSTFVVDSLVDAVYGAMIEAAKHGNIEFIKKMLEVNRELLWAHKENKNMFWHAIMNRQEKVFNLIYGASEYKSSLLSADIKDDENNIFEIEDDENNILHFAAKLPLPSVLDRISGPALQMQREVQWFEAVRKVANPGDRDKLNKSGITPCAMFTNEHKELVNAGEKSMKKTATAATTIGALIVATMFAAALAVVSGVNQSSNPSSSLVTKPFFKTFIIFDALSLFASTSSIIVFLGILASRYSQHDFLLSLPRKFMIGFYTLFCSIVTMSMAFCFGLLVMLQSGLPWIILPICLFSLVPIMLFIVSISPLLWKTYKSTYGPTIFDKATELPSTGTSKKHAESCY